VDECQDHAGLSFVNGQFMAGIEVKPSNRGPVKFTACGFWNIPTTDNHAVLEGAGHTSFTACHFVGWARKKADTPAIHLHRGGLTVTGCDFVDPGKVQVAVEAEVDAALVYGNRFRGAEKVVNRAGSKLVLATNVVSER
jgi:hypothetical protein